MVQNGFVLQQPHHCSHVRAFGQSNCMLLDFATGQKRKHFCRREVRWQLVSSCLQSSIEVKQTSVDTKKRGFRSRRVAPARWQFGLATRLGELPEATGDTYQHGGASTPQIVGRCREDNDQCSHQGKAQRGSLLLAALSLGCAMSERGRP